MGVEKVCDKGFVILFAVSAFVFVISNANDAPAKIGKTIMLVMVRLRSVVVKAKVVSKGVVNVSLSRPVTKGTKIMKTDAWKGSKVRVWYIMTVFAKTGCGSFPLSLLSLCLVPRLSAQPI